jgi:hypothetical protein
VRPGEPPRDPCEPRRDRLALIDDDRAVDRDVCHAGRVAGSQLATSAAWPGTTSLRKRRLHDARRTFISLAQTDGGRLDLLRWITHASPKDVMGGYTTFTWKDICAEVAKLNIAVRMGELMELVQPVAVGADVLVTAPVTSASSRRGNEGGRGCPQARHHPPPPPATRRAITFAVIGG